MFGTDLGHEYRVAAGLGCSPEAAFLAGLSGALCDDRTRSRLRAIADATTWQDPGAASGDDR